MRSMRNGIWAARCGDAGADTIAEAASKRNENALSEISGSIAHGAGLRKAGRGNQNPHRRPQPLHRSWHTCHRGSRLSPSVKGEAHPQADLRNKAPRTVHLPDWIDTEWLKQLVAEQLVTVRNKRGYAHPEWQKMRERNEALDCRVYARAAAWIMGADRWDEATWRRLEEQAGVEKRPAQQLTAPAEPTAPAAPEAGTPTTPRRKRRAYTPNFMRD
jgi:hypothetical protein